MYRSSADASVRKLALTSVLRGLRVESTFASAGGRTEMRRHPIDSPALKLIWHELAPGVGRTRRPDRCYAAAFNRDASVKTEFALCLLRGEVSTRFSERH